MRFVPFSFKPARPMVASFKTSLSFFFTRSIFSLRTRFGRLSMRFALPEIVAPREFFASLFTGKSSSLPDCASSTSFLRFPLIRTEPLPTTLFFPEVRLYFFQDHRSSSSFLGVVFPSPLRVSHFRFFTGAARHRIDFLFSFCDPHLKRRLVPFSAYSPIMRSPFAVSSVPNFFFSQSGFSSIQRTLVLEFDSLRRFSYRESPPTANTSGFPRKVAVFSSPCSAFMIFSTSRMLSSLWPGAFANPRGAFPFLVPQSYVVPYVQFHVFCFDLRPPTSPSRATFSLEIINRFRPLNYHSPCLSSSSDPVLVECPDRRMFNFPTSLRRGPSIPFLEFRRLNYRVDQRGTLLLIRTPVLSPFLRLFEPPPQLVSFYAIDLPANSCCSHGRKNYEERVFSPRFL